MGFWYKKNGEWYYRRMYRKDENTSMILSIPAAMHVRGGFSGYDSAVQVDRQIARRIRRLGGPNVTQSKLKSGLIAPISAIGRPERPMEEDKVARVQMSLGGVNVAQSKLQGGLLAPLSAIRVPRRSDRSMQLNVLAPIEAEPIEEEKVVPQWQDEEIDAHQPDIVDDFPSYPNYVDEAIQQSIMDAVDAAVGDEPPMYPVVRKNPLGENAKALDIRDIGMRPIEMENRMPPLGLEDEEVKQSPITLAQAQIQQWAHPDEYVKGRLTAEGIKKETKELSKRLDAEVFKEIDKFINKM